MEKLFERHYLATVKRGKINERTSIYDFLEKMSEEDDEMVEEAEKLINGQDNDFAQETIDSIGVRMNMLKKLGYDVKKELVKNVQYQEHRKD
jgi:hypothetical protein